MSSTPGLLITILWPRTTDLKFDFDYYTSVHIPLARKIWAPRGCFASYVTQAAPDSEYVYVSTLLWESEEAFAAAYGNADEMKELMEDVPKFTNVTPVFVVGKVVG